MSIELVSIVAKMTAAAKKELGPAWGEVSGYANQELKNLAHSLITIGALAFQGKISKTQAKLIMRIQKNTARMVMLTAEGLGVVRAERAVNASIKAARQAVNEKVGWKLL